MQISVFQRIRLLLAVLAQIIALGWLIIAMYFTGRYYIETGNPLRHELIIGIWLGFLYAVGFSIGSTLLAATVKGNISKIAFRLLSVPALIMGSTFLVVYFVSIAYDLASRT